MDEIKNIYNKDLKFYKDYLKKEKIDYKNLIKYFSEADHLEDQRFDPNSFYLPRKKDYGFVKINMKNSLGKYIFYVSSYQTTNSQFNSFLNNSNYKCDYQYPKHEHNHPVAWVSWFDAIAYSKWINKIFKSKIITQSAFFIAKFPEIEPFDPPTCIFFLSLSLRTPVDPGDKTTGAPIRVENFLSAW